LVIGNAAVASGNYQLPITNYHFGGFMAEQTLWEYRVVSVGSWLGTKPEAVEEALNALGQEGWEVVSVASEPAGGSKLFVVAKRPQAQADRRRRAYPGEA
jgi:hypothetical protein